MLRREKKDGASFLFDCKKEKMFLFAEIQLFCILLYFMFVVHKTKLKVASPAIMMPSIRVATKRKKTEKGKICYVHHIAGGFISKIFYF